MIVEEKSERRDQSSFSCLENINFRKFLPWAPELEYPPLVTMCPVKEISCKNSRGKLQQQQNH